MASVWLAYALRMSSEPISLDKVPIYAGDTPAIRQSYASCTLNTLLNRQAYAKMSIHVVDTSDIRYKYVTHALSMRYQYASCTVHLHASVCQRMTSVLDL